VATIGLTAFKLAVALVSGSVGVLSEAIHSFLDLVSAALSFFTVREAGKPADEDHPFGHGKIETLSSLFESILLAVAAILIVVEGIDRLQHPEPLSHGGLAMFAMLMSIAVSFWVYRHNSHAARESDSSALHVNALHFLSDVVASLGILVGLILMRLTGWLVLDPIMAFLVAAYILFISLRQVKVALLELSDTQLPRAEIARIQTVLDEGQRRHPGEWIESHHLRTRKSGANRHIDFHLVVCGRMSVTESHDFCDQVEDRLVAVYPRASVNIHVEPCEHSEGDRAPQPCLRDCPRKNRRATDRRPL
jgi:cation diffusion facilitator family transporter